MILQNRILFGLLSYIFFYIFFFYYIMILNFVLFTFSPLNYLGWVLRRPKEFLEELMERMVKLMGGGNNQEMELVTQVYRGSGYTTRRQSQLPRYTGRVGATTTRRWSLHRQVYIRDDISSNVLYTYLRRSSLV